MQLTILYFLIFIFTDQTEVRYKSRDEYDLKMDYKFKDRPPEENKPAYEADPKRAQKSSGQLPYLVMTITVLSVTDQEVRVKVTDINRKTRLNRKVAKDSKIEIDWGFSEDVKDHIVPHVYTIDFLDEQKIPVSRIFLVVEEDGTLLVNGEKRGKL